MPSDDTTTTPNLTTALISPNLITKIAAAGIMHANNDDIQNQRNVIRASVNQFTDSDLIMFVQALYDVRTRCEALDVLAKVVNFRPNKTLELAPMLWNAPGIIYILLQEVMIAYRVSDNEESLKNIAARVLNVICLFQCIAMHSGLRKQFVAAQIPVYLYPFIRHKESTPTADKLRLSSLGTLGALVKMHDPEMIHYLLDSQVFPCCLYSLEFGDQLSKSVAVYIMYKLLASESGLQYCCKYSERFLSVLQVLQKTVEETPDLNVNTTRMLKFIIGSYHVLSEFPRACEYIKLYFPSRFCSGHFVNLLQKVDPKVYEDFKKLWDKLNAEMIRLRLPPLGIIF